MPDTHLSSRAYTAVAQHLTDMGYNVVAATAVGQPSADGNAQRVAVVYANPNGADLYFTAVFGAGFHSGTTMLTPDRMHKSAAAAFDALATYYEMGF